MTGGGPSDNHGLAWTAGIIHCRFRVRRLSGGWPGVAACRSVKMPVLPFSCRWPCRLSRLLAGGLGFDEGGDAVVQLIDPAEAAMAARDDGDFRVRHEASSCV